MSSVNSKQNCPEHYPFPSPNSIHTAAPPAESTEIPASPQNKGFLCLVPRPLGDWRELSGPGRLQWGTEPRKTGEALKDPAQPPPGEEHAGS